MDAQVKLNPYVAGNPVGGGPAFVGRDNILQQVYITLGRTHENTLLLHGQRRIGKTSILLELDYRLRQEGLYYPVYIDLQDKASLPLAKLLQYIADRIAQALNLTSPSLDLQDAEETFRDSFLSGIFDLIPQRKSIVLLLDEFDVLDDPSEERASATFFPYLRTLIGTYPQRLQFVFTIGRQPEDLTNITHSVLKGTRTYQISLLEKHETINLISLAEDNGTLRWSDDARVRIYQITNGHPFLTQQLCQEIWEKLYQDELEGVPTVDKNHVEEAVEATLRSARQALEWLWNGLSPAQRIVASALAELGQDAFTLDEMERHLQENGVRLLVGELQNAPDVLTEWGLLSRSEENGRYTYNFPVELLRRWIVSRKPLRRVQEEIDRIEPVAESLFQAASGLFRSKKLDEAIPLLEQAVGLNPNHVGASQLLGELLIARGDTEGALRVLEGLYQFKPAAARPRLVQALLQRAKSLPQGESLEVYERILKISPGQPEALKSYRLICLDLVRNELVSKRIGNAYELFLKKAEIESSELTDSGVETHNLLVGRSLLTQLIYGRFYGKAFDIARYLHQRYPKESLPGLQFLENRMRADQVYKQAEKAILAGANRKAIDHLIEFINIEPRYKDSSTALGLYVVAKNIRKRMGYPVDDSPTDRYAAKTQQNPNPSPERDRFKQDPDQKQKGVTLRRLRKLSFTAPWSFLLFRAFEFASSAVQGMILTINNPYLSTVILFGLNGVAFLFLGFVWLVGLALILV